MDDNTFYGPYKVEFVTDVDDKNVELTFVNGTKEIVTKKTFAISITQEQKDWNYLQEQKLKTMMGEIMGILLSYDIKMYEANAVLKDIGTNITERYGRAMNYLWTKDDSKYVFGTDPTDFFTLIEAEKILNSIPPKDESKPETKE